jgi:hypothetical protein
VHEVARWIRCVAAGALLWGFPAQAQGGSPTRATTVIGAVIEYRLNWLGDSTKFDACRAFRVAGEPADFPAGIRSQAHRLLDERDDPCRRHSASRQTEENKRRIVLVDSLIQRDSMTYVFLTVRRGEKTHRENYTMRVAPAGGFAGVKSVTLWGAIQVHQPRQPSRRRRPAAP